MTERTVVTGASSGIGAAFARELGRRGIPVLLVGRDAERLDDVAAGVPRSRTLVADLATDAGLAATEQAIADAPVGLLVNNAGTAGPGTLSEHTDHDIDAQVALNLTAVARLSRAALPPMLRRGRGGIVMVSSSAAVHPTAGTPVYSATKAAVEALAGALRHEAAPHGVRVTVVRPGFTRTPFHDRHGEDVSWVPAWRWATPEQVASAALDAQRRDTAVVEVPDTRLRDAAGRVLGPVVRMLGRRNHH